MKIEILGSGCPKCRSLTALVECVVKETGVAAEIDKVEDVAEIVKRAFNTHSRDRRRGQTCRENNLGRGNKEMDWE